MSLTLSQTLLSGYGVVLVLLNTITFATYGIDKWRAKKAGARRISERTLHGLSWLGGVGGGWLGRRVFRHKTRKPRFFLHLSLASILHLSIVAVMARFALFPR